MMKAEQSRKVFEHGYVKLTNIAGPIRRREEVYDASAEDIAHAARMSFDKPASEFTREQNLGLVRYLMLHKHNTPIEMIETWWEMKMPIFVARQFIRHRTASVNEISARYTQLDDDFYIPKISDIGHRPVNMKQGRIIDEGFTEENALWREQLHDWCIQAYENYEMAIKEGIPPEVARMGLPLNIHTKWIWKQDLHNLIHFLDLRIDEHAQFESRNFAQPMVSMLDKALPGFVPLWMAVRNARKKYAPMIEQEAREIMNENQD